MGDSIRNANRTTTLQQSPQLTGTRGRTAEASGTTEKTQPKPRKKANARSVTDFLLGREHGVANRSRLAGRFSAVEYDPFLCEDMVRRPSKRYHQQAKDLETSIIRKNADDPDMAKKLALIHHRAEAVGKKVVDDYVTPIKKILCTYEDGGLKRPSLFEQVVVGECTCRLLKAAERKELDKFLSERKEAEKTIVAELGREVALSVVNDVGKRRKGVTGLGQAWKTRVAFQQVLARSLRSLFETGDFATAGKTFGSEMKRRLPTLDYVGYESRPREQRASGATASELQQAHPVSDEKSKAIASLVDDMVCGLHLSDPASHPENDARFLGRRLLSLFERLGLLQEPPTA